MKIAVSGKGGSGKTTISGTLARLFGQRGYDVLAIDADDNPNLALTAGIPREESNQVDPLPDGLLTRKEDEEGNAYLELTESVDSIIQDHGVPVKDRVKLLKMGEVDHAGAG